MRLALSEVNGNGLNTGGKRILNHPSRSFYFKAEGWKSETKQKADNHNQLRRTSKQNAVLYICPRLITATGNTEKRTGVEKKTKSENSHSSGIETFSQNSHQNLNVKWPKVHQLKKEKL